VPPGTPSAAVLITSLENRLQPLIRYRLTDSFTEEPPAEIDWHDPIGDPTGTDEESSTTGGTSIGVGKGGWRGTGMPSSLIRGRPGQADVCQWAEACLLAVARGARYVEKHFTLNKTSAVIRDHVLSATPAEFRQLTELGKPLARLLEVVDRARAVPDREPGSVASS